MNAGNKNAYGICRLWALTSKIWCECLFYFYGLRLCFLHRRHAFRKYSYNLVSKEKEKFKKKLRVDSIIILL